MHFSFTVQPATFLQRPNRFVIHARLHKNNQTVRAHCPNPGRMHELMVPGATVYLDRADDPARRTAYTLRFVEHPDCGQLISLNTQLPNRLFAEGQAAGFFPQFGRYSRIEREVSLPNGGEGTTSRIDFRLSASDGAVCWVETKSATLVHGDWAIFPDAPTARGRRHLHELMALSAGGDATAVVFILQRPDADYFTANRHTDPDFAETLHQAAQMGVALYAYTCGLTTKKMWLARQIPVITDQAKLPANFDQLFA